MSHTATRVAIAAVVGIPAANLAMQRRIYFMVRQSSSNETTAQVRISVVQPADPTEN